MRCYWVNILASQPQGTLYIGVTNDILGRIERHRTGIGSRFTAKYGVGSLVYFEEFADVKQAIQREIEHSNPQWVDLFPGLVARHGLPGEGVR